MVNLFNSILENIKKYKAFFKDNSFKARFAKGGIWLSIGGGADVALKMLRNMILARLIAPEAFGTVAIVYAVSSLFEVFTQMGINDAIVQSEHGHKKEFLNGAWWLSVGRGFFLCFVGFICTPLITSFYEIPKLTPLLRIAFLGLIFSTSISSKAYTNVKDMEFMRYSAFSFAGSLLGTVVSIFLSFKIDGAWALVIGFVAESFGRFLVSHILCPFRPGFSFKKEYFNALIKFSRGMFGLPILTFLFMKTDVFVIGKLCTQSELGIYSLAVALASMPDLIMGKLITPLLIPAFSEIQKDNNKINNRIFQFTYGLSFISIPAVMFIFFSSEVILRLVYGQKYISASLPFAILFMSNIFRAISIPIAAVYISKGRPDIHRFFTIIRSSLLLILIYPAIKLLGYSGAAFAVCVAMLLSFVVQIQRLHSLTSLQINKYYNIILKALLYSSPFLIWLIISKIFLYKFTIENTIVNIIGLIITYILLIYKNVMPLLKNINNE